MVASAIQSVPRRQPRSVPAPSRRHRARFVPCDPVAQKRSALGGGGIFDRIGLGWLQGAHSQYFPNLEGAPHPLAHCQAENWGFSPGAPPQEIVVLAVE